MECLCAVKMSVYCDEKAYVVASTRLHLSRKHIASSTLVNTCQSHLHAHLIFAQKWRLAAMTNSTAQAKLATQRVPWFYAIIRPVFAPVLGPPSWGGVLCKALVKY